MVDFGKRVKNKTLEKKKNPIEIYDSLDRRSETGPLRPSQVSILEEWFSKRVDDVDNIVKLHTGEGKTLIGLLMLQSKLNATGEPCLFLCPNIYLANQVKAEAQKFGIAFCEIDGTELPDGFVSGKEILITHVQKVFNAKTIFKLNNRAIQVNSVVLDDSHACIDAIRDSLTIKVDQSTDVYKKIIQLFENELSDQGVGSFLEVKSGSYTTMLPIPYWSWIDKVHEVTTILQQNSDTDEIKFVWDVIKNDIKNCQAFVSGQSLEISPLLMPIDSFGTFSKAKHRILMSATTQDDAFAIKGLGIDVKAIKNPLANTALKWSGEKMVLIPSLIDQRLTRQAIIEWLAVEDKKRRYGVVALIPDFKREDDYKQVDAIVATRKNIFANVQKLKNGDYDKAIVFANRYDGIDLPDDACRILILDGKPYFDSLLDRYEEDCRAGSDIFNAKIAQKVEQGLGRSVRGEKDYSVIIILGNDLIKFLKSTSTTRHFSSQTRKQIDIGMQVVEFAQEDLEEDTNPFEVVDGLITKSLRRDAGWKTFYVEEMESIDAASQPIKLYDSLKLEYEAEIEFKRGNIEKACLIIQGLADKLSDQPLERGWYLQSLARYKYSVSKIESNDIQKTAFKLNPQLLKPKTGVVYKKLEPINDTRLTRIRSFVTSFDSYAELNMAVNDLIENLSFGVAHEKFEQTVQQLGELLGFQSQRPDKLIRKGPDNLWGGVDNQYFLLECKSEVEASREDISKDEAGQMNSHCGWFEEEYGSAPFTPILIIPTKKLSYHGNFTHPVKIMRKGKLNKLKNNVRSFISEFAAYDIHQISDSKLSSFLTAHHLDVQSLQTDYVEDFVR